MNRLFKKREKIKNDKLKKIKNLTNISKKMKINF